MKKTSIALGLLLSGCVASEPPPATPPQPFPAPVLTPPPWERGSLAGGSEMSVPLGPMVVIRGATLLLATGRTIAQGTLVLDKGKIAALFAGDVLPPAGSVVIDGKGKFVTSGLIDVHSHLGVYPMPEAAAHEDGNEMVGPLQPQVLAADAFWPQDPALLRAVKGGVTTMQVLPGSGNLIGGRAVTVKLRPGLSSRAMHFRGAPDGLKMACGENPKRVYNEKKQAPMTRMGNLALQRAAFLAAKKLEREWQRYAEQETKRALKDAKKRADYDLKKRERDGQQAYCHEDPTRDRCPAWAREWRDKPLEAPEPNDVIEPPARDPGLETLVGALQGRVLVNVHCYRADDMLDMLALADEVGFKVKSFHHALEASLILSALAVAREFDLDPVIAGGAEAWRVRKTLARSKVPVIVYPLLAGPETFDMLGARDDNAALLFAAGVPVALSSGETHNARKLRQGAGNAVRAGLPHTAAIEAITRAPAAALGMGARYGTLAPGKVANLVLWSGDPLEIQSQVVAVFIHGKKQPLVSRQTQLFHKYRGIAR